MKLLRTIADILGAVALGAMIGLAGLAAAVLFLAALGAVVGIPVAVCVYVVRMVL